MEIIQIRQRNRNRKWIKKIGLHSTTPLKETLK